MDKKYISNLIKVLFKMQKLFKNIYLKNEMLNKKMAIIEMLIKNYIKG